jgi:hypothetical protein
MNGLFQDAGVSHVPTLRISTVEGLGAVQETLGGWKRPYFIKVDDGYNSLGALPSLMRLILGLNNSCVLGSVEEVVQKAREMISLYGPIVIQRFIRGRGTLFLCGWCDGRVYGRGGHQTRLLAR